MRSKTVPVLLTNTVEKWYNAKDNEAYYTFVELSVLRKPGFGCVIMMPYRIILYAQFCFVLLDPSQIPISNNT